MPSSFDGFAFVGDTHHEMGLEWDVVDVQK